MRPIRTRLINPLQRVRASVRAALEAHPVAPALMAVLVDDHGRRILAHQEGWRRSGSGSGDANRVTPQDVFCLGSVSKPIMGYALACGFRERRFLGWGTRLSRAFPEFAAPAFRKRHGIREEYLDLTLEQLMSHCGGRPGDPDLGHDWLLRTDTGPLPEAMLPGYTSDASERARRYNYLLTWFSAPPQTTPGTPSGYSSCGAITAAALLEREFKADYREVTDRLLFRPLGITAARWRRTATTTTPNGVWQHGYDDQTGAISTDLFGTTKAYENHSHSPSGALAMNGAGFGTLLASLLQHPATPGPLSQGAIETALRVPSYQPEVSRMGWVWHGDERWHNGANGRMYAVGEFNRVEGWAIGTATNIGGQVGVAIVDAARLALKSLRASL